MDAKKGKSGTKYPMRSQKGSQKGLKTQAGAANLPPQPPQPPPPPPQPPAPADKRRSSVATVTEQSRAETGSEQQPQQPQQRSRRVTYSSSTAQLELPRFSIITDEAQTGLTEYGFENPRFSTKTGRASIMEQSVPTKSTVDFYARQSQVNQAAHRHSQLADELGRMQITKQLVSSRFSSSVVTEVLDNGGRSGPRHSYGPQKSSLRYPDVGKLDLQDSDSEVDELQDS